jgi:hypothetical protein
VQNRKALCADKKETMEDAYHRTLDRKNLISLAGFNIIEKWGCDLDKDLADNDQMKEFFKQTKIMQALDARNGELNLSVKIFNQQSW